MILNDAFFDKGIKDDIFELSSVIGSINLIILSTFNSFSYEGKDLKISLNF
jgi:hypothetical protein